MHTIIHLTGVTADYRKQLIDTVIRNGTVIIPDGMTRSALIEKIEREMPYCETAVVSVDRIDRITNKLLANFCEDTGMRFLPVKIELP